MPRHLKASLKFIVSLILLSSFNSLFAQQVKKTTTKSTTVVKKPAVSKTKTTVFRKTTSTKTRSPKILPAAELKMSTRETQMVEEINLVRSDPAGYVKFIKDFLKTSNAGKHTIAAANELMDELKRLQPLNTLKINMDMYRDAKGYGVSMMQNNSIEHSDLPYNENLSFGIENIREVIIDLLIDDDIPDRGHRRNILKKNISMIAVHELPGTVEDYQHCYIQEFR